MPSPAEYRRSLTDKDMARTGVKMDLASKAQALSTPDPDERGMQVSFGMIETLPPEQRDRAFYLAATQQWDELNEMLGLGQMEEVMEQGMRVQQKVVNGQVFRQLPGGEGKWWNVQDKDYPAAVAIAYRSTAASIDKEIKFDAKQSSGGSLVDELRGGNQYESYDEAYNEKTRRQVKRFRGLSASEQHAEIQTFMQDEAQMQVLGDMRGHRPTYDEVKLMMEGFYLGLE
jgi:hypothetical protein